jgi:IS30 family transposase
MGMVYHQLTEGERNQIYALLQEDVSLRRIAVILRRDSSTVLREEIAFVMERLNHRPRKTLAFKTPHDIFVKSESNGFTYVALGS